MEKAFKILFLVAHRPGRSPGQRFRFEQYLDCLKENGVQYDISYLISEADDAVFYASGRYLAKARFLFKSIRQRLADLKQLHRYDMVFLYREAHMLGSTWFERQIKKSGIKMVVDFDDSIWLKDVSNGNRRIAFLKRPSKTHRIVALSDACIVGNQYLADYALQYTDKVFVVPTTIDTSQYLMQKQTADNTSVCIGWTGSSTTIKHFSLAIPVFKRLRHKYGSGVTFRVISDEFWDGELEGLQNVRWRKETEIEDLAAIDIGIMPLPDDDWSKGKCGFKGLQYMALGKPAVMSPIGVNNDIIEHGHNGFLADSLQQWEEILSRLVEDAGLRETIGTAGRKTVVERFSYDAQKDRYVDIIKGILED